MLRTNNLKSFTSKCSMSDKTNNCYNKPLNENGLTKNIFFQSKNLMLKYKKLKGISI